MGLFRRSERLLSIAGRQVGRIRLRRCADECSCGRATATQRTEDDAQSHWQEIQADWDRHRERMQVRLDNAKAGYDLTVTELEVESAEADAFDAIAFAASAVLDAERAMLNAGLARRRAVAVAATS